MAAEPGATRPSSPPEVAAFLRKSQIAWARATRKLEDVLQRVACGAPALEDIREIWVFGSYARGAAEVGDIDLLVRLDTTRERGQVALDLFYARSNPFAPMVKALGCSGRSFVSVQPQVVFEAEDEPLSPERAAHGGTGLAITEPVLHHVVTDEPLAGPFVLLWARGDELEWALKRLREIPVNEGAGRHDRTTSVPLIDDLAERLSLPVAFPLAVQVRAGNIRCEARLLPAADAPPATHAALRRRYFKGRDAPVSAREAAAAATLVTLDEEGLDLRVVRLVDSPVTVRPVRDPPFLVIDFNAFGVYRFATGDVGASRWIHVWPGTPRGPWLALDLSVVDPGALRATTEYVLDRQAPRNERTRRMLEALSL